MINWTDLKASLQLRRVSLVWYSIGITAYGWMLVAFYPLMGKSPAYSEMIEKVFSDELKAAFGGAGLNFGTLGGFFGLEYLTLIWVFIVATAVITFIGGALGGSVEDGTMEVTLSQPVSRSTVAFTRYVGMVIYAIVLNFVTVASIYLPGFLHDVDVPLDAMGLLFAAGLLVTLAIGSFAFLVSALSSARGQTVAVSLGVMIAMYLANVLGSLADKARWMVNISMFHYWIPDKIIDDLHVASETWVVFGVATVVFFAAGMWAFRKRDVV